MTSMSYTHCSDSSDCNNLIRDADLSNVEVRLSGGETQMDLMEEKLEENEFRDSLGSFCSDMISVIFSLH